MTIEKTFFVYDPETNEFLTFETADERDISANDLIDNALEDDGWLDSVEQIAVGQLSHRVKQTNLVPRPDDIDPDTGCCGEGEYWPDGISYKCNYELAD